MRADEKPRRSALANGVIVPRNAFNEVMCEIETTIELFDAGKMPIGDAVAELRRLSRELRSLIPGGSR